VRASGLEFGAHQAIGWGSPVEAAAVYHNWSPERASIEISVAGNGAWITRKRVREMFGYPFAFCNVVYGFTESPVLLRAWRHLGGDEHHVPGLRPIVTLTREQWERYHNGR
jgi:hypothetical protein